MNYWLALLISVTLIVPSHADAQSSQFDERFRRLDRNGDGKLSRDELRQTPNIMRADGNSDGFVTLEEVRNYAGNGRGVGRPEPNSRLDEAPKGIFRRHQEIPISSGPMAVGVLDADVDGWPDLVFPSGRVSGQFVLALNRADTKSGRAFDIKTMQMSSDPADNSKRRTPKGLGLHDFNNDGRMDVYLANRDGGGPSLAPDGKTVRPASRLSSSINSVQLSRGDGTFTTQDIGINSRGSEVRSVVFADFDGDGHTDSFHAVSPYYGPGWGGSPIGNELHAGTDKWDRFGPDVIRETLPDPAFWQDEHGRAIKMFKATLIRDFNGDGLPDIATGAYADIWGGSFRRMQTREDAKLDLDKDGIPDTSWPGDWDRGLFLLRNASTSGKIRFEDASNSALEKAYSNGMKYPQMHVYSIIAADIDHDGDLDLLVTGPRNVSAHRSVEDMTPTARMLRNDSTPGRMQFTDITKAAGFDFLNGRQAAGFRSGRQTVPNLAAGAAVDYDNDSHVDFVFVCRRDGAPDDPALKPWVFHNDGSGNFKLIPPKDHGLDGHFNDLSYTDFDNDGRLDLIFVHGDPRSGAKAVIYRNAVENSNHWIKLNVSWRENKFGIGSKVTVFRAGTKEILGYDEVRTDFCYRSKRSPTLHFGIGSVDRIDVEVITRHGRRKRFKGLTADAQHKLEMSEK